MPVRSDVLLSPYFWAFIAELGFHCDVSTEAAPDEAMIARILGIDRESLKRWGHKFTGWYPGIFDKSDGYLDDPNVS